MISHWLSARLARHDIYYGWAVVAATFLTTLASAASISAPGVFIVPLEQEFQWSNAEISSALSIRLLLYGLVAPFAAALINRYGMRNVVISALTTIVAGLTLSLFMTEVWQLILLWGIVVGTGTGMIALVLGATVAARWFVERRGLVVGLFAASTATGQLLFLPLFAGLTELYSWRVATIALCILMAIAALSVLLVVRDRPSDLALRPFGDDGSEPIAPPPIETSITSSALNALRDASQSRTFWVLFFTFYICGASTNGLIQTHFIALCGDYSIPATGAATLLAAMGIFDVIGTICSGWLSDRYDNRWLLFWYYGLRGLSLMLLPFTDFTLYGLSLFALFYGLDWVATVPPTVRLSAATFGPERANLMFGWIFAGHQLGAASTALGAGISRTYLASYLPAFFFAGLLCLIASLAALSIRRDKRSAVA
ncbi:MFS transporter [Afipia carboxidovorans]|uniref:MFS transporter n=1 Tax=Afipia carboxidovorans TaxID=40137 RepID=UPI00309325CE|nr:MFS transporter [Afipia carboxidovorans]